MQITDLYQTKITCSTYNANIDSTNTVITVKLVDFNGAAVKNKSVTLTCDKGYFNKNGSNAISGTTTKSITATTNDSGEITATWTASEWGLATFSTNTQSLQIRVSGWKTLMNDSNYTFTYNENYCSLYVHISSINFPKNITSINSNVQITDPNLRPSSAVTVLNFANTDTIFSVKEDGKFYIGSHTGSAASGLSLYCHVFYKRE